MLFIHRYIKSSKDSLLWRPLTEEMKKGTKIENCCPSQTRLSKPSHKNRCKYAGSYKACIHHGCLVTAVSQLDGAEKDHIANNPKEGEPLKKLHEEYTNNHLQLLTCLARIADHPTGKWRCTDPMREVAIMCIKSIYRWHAASGDLPVEVMFRQCWSSISKRAGLAIPYKRVKSCGCLQQSLSQHAKGSRLVSWLRFLDIVYTMLLLTNVLNFVGLRISLRWMTWRQRAEPLMMKVVSEMWDILL